MPKLYDNKSPVIDRIQLHFGRMPVQLEFSYGPMREMSYCIARIFAGDCSGVGEALHTQRESTTARARTLLGQPVRQGDALLPAEDFTWQRSVSRELLSMALQDLLSRMEGVPLAQRLRTCLGASSDLPSPLPRVPLMACVFPTSPEHARRRAEALVQQGYLALKVKIFGDAKRDAALVTAMRQALPVGHLQADANLGYKSLDQAVAALPRLADAGLDVLEDPAQVPVEQYQTLLALPHRPRLMLDAPTRGWAALRQVLAQPSCEAINLHPNMQGTFSEIIARAAAVRQAGLRVQVGGTGYTGVGAWAHLQVAAALHPDEPYGEVGGWIDHGMPASTARQPWALRDGGALVPTVPGHGGEVDWEYLARQTELVELTAPQR